MDRNSGHTLRVAIFLLFASNGLTISSWVVHIPVLKEQLQLNDQMLGFALLSAGLGSLLTMWISGRLMARYSSRAIAHLSGILFPISLMGPALATGFWSLAIALVLLGGANGLMDIAMKEAFYGRWLLTLGLWFTAVKIDTLETVAPDVAIAAGLKKISQSPTL